MEGRLCIVVGTDDGKYVKVGHFGDSRYYYYYRVEDGSVSLLKVVENPYVGIHGHHGHRGHGKREKIYELIKECNVIIATFFGPGGEAFMNEHGIRVFRVEPGASIEEALKALQ